MGYKQALSDGVTLCYLCRKPSPRGETIYLAWPNTYCAECVGAKPPPRAQQVNVRRVTEGRERCSECGSVAIPDDWLFEVDGKVLCRECAPQPVVAEADRRLEEFRRQEQASINQS